MVRRVALRTARTWCVVLIVMGAISGGHLARFGEPGSDDPGRLCYSINGIRALCVLPPANYATDPSGR